jgi:hypothetical protein
VNNSEAVTLWRLVKALCPTQPMDEATPDAWAIVLNDIRFEDAQAAVRTIYRDLGNDQEWGGRRIEADDIIREVRRIRERRLAEHPPLDPPSGLSEIEYRSWLRHTRQAIADGRQIPRPALPQRDMSAIEAIDKRSA